MITYRESDYDPNGPIRLHPYEGADYSENSNYYNFRNNPSLIKTKLEDFNAHDKFEAIQTFYKLLEWINGDSSVFESNDCAFKPPKTNISTNTSTKKLECQGRLMIFYRHLPINIQTASNEWLLNATDFYIARTDPNFMDGVIGLSFMDTAFTSLKNAVGRELVLQWWVFGDTEEETYENLNRLFINLKLAFEGVSEEIAEGMRKQNLEPYA